MTSGVVALGFGKYPQFINPMNFPLMGLEANFGQSIGILAVVWSKTSFAITLLRLTKGRTKWIIWYIIISMNLIMILLSIFTWTQCTPVAKTWNKMLPGTCWNQNVVNGYNVFTSIYSGVCDITLALLPWHLIWNLQMKKKEKLGVGFAMSMGLL